MAEIILYTAPDCHLCDLAKDVLYPLISEYQVKLHQVDISQDAKLKEQYGLKIPVIKLPNGAEKAWPFSAGQVKKLLLS